MIGRLTIVVSILLSQVLEQAKIAACHQQNVTFLHLIPCWRENEAGICSRSAAQKSCLDSCDLLASVAMDLAIERVNENQGALSQYVRTVPLFPDINDNEMNVSG